MGEQRQRGVGAGVGMGTEGAWRMGCMWSRGLRRWSLWKRSLVCRGVRTDSRGAAETGDGLGYKVKWSSLYGVDVVCWVCWGDFYCRTGSATLWLHRDTHSNAGGATRLQQLRREPQVTVFVFEYSRSPSLINISTQISTL
jgi:hypothetical protein